MAGSTDIHQKRGALSLEAAMVIPAVMILLYLFIWQISSVRNEMIFRSILMKESERISLTGIAFEIAGSNSSVQDFISRNGEMTGMLMDETYRLVLEKSCLTHYQRYLANKKNFTRILRPEYSLTEREITGDIIYYTAVYSLHTPFGKTVKTFTIPLRTWYRGDSSGKVCSGGTDGNVWAMDNFERGKLIRERFGGNLPFGYPVLSGYSDGNALVVRSMDMTRDTWSVLEQVRMELRTEINEFILFEGTEYPWGKDAIRICDGDIRFRVFRLVIPENTDMIRYRQVFDELNGYCRANGVEFEIICFQKSGIQAE